MITLTIPGPKLGGGGGGGVPPDPLFFVKHPLLSINDFIDINNFAKHHKCDVYYQFPPFPLFLLPPSSSVIAKRKEARKHSLGLYSTINQTKEEPFVLEPRGSGKEYSVLKISEREVNVCVSLC